MSPSEEITSQSPEILEKIGIHLSRVAELDSEQQRQLVTVLSTWALKEYVALRQDGPHFDIVDPHVTTATEAAVGASAMLSAVNVETFELAMWQGMGNV